MINTLVGIAILVVGALTLEFVTIGQDGWPTISVAIQYLGLHWNPFVIYVCSVLLGHFFLKPNVNLAQYIGEWGEVFVVVWIGWGIFWFFYGKQNLLPLSTFERIILIVLSIAVGALIWTIEYDITSLYAWRV